MYQLLQEDLPIAGKATVASNAKRKRAKIAFKALCARLRCAEDRSSVITFRLHC